MRWLHAHKLLLVVFAAGIALASFELQLPEERRSKPESPQAFLEPETNIADVSIALYPERALTLYYRAFRASLCSVPQSVRPAECRRLDRVEPGEIRQLLERSLATGNRSIELAMYNYALVLIQERAPAREIDAAIRTWRTTHPYSSRRDPRTMIRKITGGFESDDR